MFNTFISFFFKNIFTPSMLFLTLTNPLSFIKDLHIIKPDLKFNENGKFKIVQFADIQDGPKMNKKTLVLMNQILDYEKPDLVILTGDNLDCRCKTKEDVITAIKNIASPMEKRNIYWATVFGNHDAEQNKLTEEEMMKLYMSYPKNISEFGPNNLGRIGNYNLLIKGSSSKAPEFNIYLLNSGRYAASKIGGYDWVNFNQITWYRNTCEALKNKYEKTIPALMFFHIPLPEFKTAFNEKVLSGNKNEEECSPKLNSGLFTSIVEMGDVRGIFVGHDHTNDYVALLNGIKLGFARNVGYGTYGKRGLARGARVFLINENDPNNFETWMRIQSDF